MTASPINIDASRVKDASPGLIRRWKAVRLIAFLLLILVPLPAGAQALTSISGDHIGLSMGQEDGVGVGATGRVVSKENVGGVSVRVVLAVFRVDEVGSHSATAVVLRGDAKNIAPGMAVVFDRSARPKRQPSAGRTTPVRQTEGFVEVPSGAFVMGCNANDSLCDPDERPAHSVVISRPFLIAANETTNGQYRKCVRSGTCSEPHASPHLFRSPIFEHVPVLGVTWQQARDFCAFIGGRLPSEAEWEFAALGGSRTPRTYPWGNDPPSCWSGGGNGARFDDDQNCDDSGPAIVGSFDPNEYGLFDLAGNAWEWTADIYDADYYSRSPRRDPKGPLNGARVVARGGSWSSSGKALRISNRLAVRNGDTSANIGFRCVKEKQ